MNKWTDDLIKGDYVFLRTVDKDKNIYKNQNLLYPINRLDKVKVLSVKKSKSGKSIISVSGSHIGVKFTDNGKPTWQDKDLGLNQWIEPMSEDNVNRYKRTNDRIRSLNSLGRTDFGTLTTNQLIQIEKILNIHSEKNL